MRILQLAWQKICEHLEQEYGHRSPRRLANLVRSIRSSARKQGEKALDRDTLENIRRFDNERKNGKAANAAVERVWNIGVHVDRAPCGLPSEAFSKDDSITLHVDRAPRGDRENRDYRERPLGDLDAEKRLYLLGASSKWFELVYQKISDDGGEIRSVLRGRRHLFRKFSLHLVRKSLVFASQALGVVKNAVELVLKFGNPFFQPFQNVHILSHGHLIHAYFSKNRALKREICNFFEEIYPVLLRHLNSNQHF